MQGCGKRPHRERRQLREPGMSGSQRQRVCERKWSRASGVRTRLAVRQSDATGHGRAFETVAWKRCSPRPSAKASGTGESLSNRASGEGRLASATAWVSNCKVGGTSRP